MSYGPPPPKTPYGDQDFIKEDWSSGNQSYFNRPLDDQQAPRQTSSPYATPSPYGGNLVNSAGVTQPNQQLQQQFDVKNQALQAARSLTPEDHLFIKSWRQDSFYYRVLPMAISSNGLYYYYNHIKELPHKMSRYLMLTGLCYFVGKMSYRGELRRRIESNPSQTPFMNALRQMTGVQSITMGEFSSTLDTNDLSSGSTDNWSFSESFSDNSSNTQNSSTVYSQSYQPPFDTTSNAAENPKVVTSYEELRAKNRGMIPNK